MQFAQKKKINPNVQGELPPLDKWHPQATLLIKRKSAATAGGGRRDPAQKSKPPCSDFVIKGVEGNVRWLKTT